jgi:F-type H+-transporting ATPase subunit epsilon
MRVEVVTPERVIFAGDASMVVTRTLDGEIAFQPNHAPFLGALVENHTRIYVEGDKVENLAVHGGFVEVSGNRVSILSDLAEFASEIDVEEVRRELEEAERKLLGVGSPDDDPEAAAAVRRANARLSAAGG